ncbi:MAG: nitrophenyl compound nitroreductase subunit ArsF family protein [Methanoregula sp.]|nr:nitrophenyl compound nitroreductase subunit ArsF family protein [Methanoregula sp.]
MTNPQRIYPVVIFVALIIACGFAAGCTVPAKSSSSIPAATRANGTVERVEVFHFHGNNQCTSCIAVGDLAEKTINTHFKDELASRRLVFAHVNAEQPENAALAAKYGVTGSSLWIGVYDVNGFHKEQDIRVWSLINSKDLYATYLSAIITKRLNGDLS